MKFYKIFISFVVINILLGSSHKFNQPFIDVAESSNPSIVSIISEIEVRQRQFNPFFNDPFFQDLFPEFKRKGQTLGSGVIISSDGYIITNNHVIDDADKIKVIMYDKTEFEASVIGVDPLSDLAVIKIEADVVLPEITMGNSDKLSVGEWVVAIGSPFGLHLNHTVTAGIVSATGRSNVISKLTYEDFIQHDAAINPGNSGGALLNLDGELVGINTAIATDGYSKSNAGVGFAIPINQAIRVIDDLLDDGSVSRGWLGVQIQNIDQAIADALNLENKDGALIVSIVPDSPASESGLQEDDIIIKVDSKDINNDRALMKAISSKRPGDFTNFTVIRGDEKLRISVTLGKRPDEVAVDEEKNIEQQSYDILGLKVIDNKDNDGVKVIDIKEGSSAYKNGIKKNDIIKKISRKKINNLSDYENQINQFNIGDVIMLRIERNGNQGIRAFTIE
tara:strand:+ start:12025 stop:13374 length:1350 start_codon:yes stop_codon:yes gene_type:complete